MIFNHQTPCKLFISIKWVCLPNIHVTIANHIFPAFVLQPSHAQRPKLAKLDVLSGMIRAPGGRSTEVTIYGIEAES